MQTIQVNLPDIIAATFEQACLGSEQLRQNVLQELVTRYLEDIEDVRDAMAVLARNEPTIPLAEIERKYGLAD